jgi:UDP-N-acetylmuramate dehydrogenase
MKEKKNFSLKDFNTFGVDVNAKYFLEVEYVQEFPKILEKYVDEKLFVLGGGSNTLFVNDWDGVVIKLKNKGKKVLKGDSMKVFCNAGEDWDDFVEWTVENGYAGIEKMVMIPGTVGGAVSQNIGAYGQTISDVLVEIEALDIQTKKEILLKPEDCGFEYRSSNFKKDWKNKYIVLSAVFKLEKGKNDLLESLNYVKKQREKKLPSVKDFGTCGSFFKNPFVTKEKYEEICKKIPDLDFYIEKDLRKIPAGKLLDELGWKGKWNGNVGVFEKHALCVVTNKEASGKEILEFSKEMKDDVKKNFDIDLEEEVNVVF